MSESHCAQHFLWNMCVKHFCLEDSRGYIIKYAISKDGVKLSISAHRQMLISSHSFSLPTPRSESHKLNVQLECSVWTSIVSHMIMNACCLSEFPFVPQKEEWNLFKYHTFLNLMQTQNTKHIVLKWHDSGTTRCKVSCEQHKNHWHQFPCQVLCLNLWTRNIHCGL